MRLRLLLAAAAAAPLLGMALAAATQPSYVVEPAPAHHDAALTILGQP